MREKERILNDKKEGTKIMKTNEIARKYSIDELQFEKYVKEMKLEHQETFWNSDMLIEDEKVDEYVSNFKKYLEEERRLALEKHIVQREEKVSQEVIEERIMREKSEDSDNMMVSLLRRQVELLESIKGMLTFFTVLTVIGIVLGIIGFIALYS